MKWAWLRLTTRALPLLLLTALHTRRAARALYAAVRWYALMAPLGGALPLRGALPLARVCLDKLRSHLRIEEQDQESFAESPARTTIRVANPPAASVSLLADDRVRRLQEKVVRGVLLRECRLPLAPQDARIFAHFSSVAWIRRNIMNAAGCRGGVYPPLPNRSTGGGGLPESTVGGEASPGGRRGAHRRAPAAAPAVSPSVPR